MSRLPSLLQARYGDAAPKIDLQSNDFIASLLDHRSVRAFLPDALEPGTLELLVAAAQSAPSSSNLQPWSVIAIEDKAHKARLAKLSRDQKQIHEAPLFLAWVADLNRARRIAEKLGSASEGLDYLESFLLGVIDTTLAAQNVVAAAESLGLGTVYIGALRGQPEEVAAELRLPPEVFPVFGLVIGKPDPSRPADVKPRLPQEAVLHREYYQADQEAAIATYDRVIGSFYAQQKLPQQAWTTHSTNRVKDAAALGGRDRIAEAIRNLGFKIR